jgi:hypothetical protein
MRPPCDRLRDDVKQFLNGSIADNCWVHILETRNAPSVHIVLKDIPHKNHSKLGIRVRKSNMS